jgi:putative hydrolase of HD superfamily
MALVHDLPEAVTGDRTPFDEHGTTPEARRAVSSDPPAHDEWRNAALRAAKHESERAGLEVILSSSPPLAANAVRTAWEDYEAGESAEAQLVSQLDKLEAYLQGKEYAYAGRLPDATTLASFQVDCDILVTVPPLRAILDALETMPWSSRPDSREGKDQRDDPDEGPTV